MTKEPRYFTSMADARDAFLTDVHTHRDNIKKAFDKYGKAFCEKINANYDRVIQMVLAHDLSKINEDVESIGLISFFYQYPKEGLELDSPRRRYLYQKSLLNHYHINSNHPEHWLKYHDGVLIAVKMDPESVVEMVLDWIAVGYENGYSNVIEYWEEVRYHKLFNEETIVMTEMLIESYKEINNMEQSKYRYARSAYLYFHYSEYFQLYNIIVRNTIYLRNCKGEFNMFNKAKFDKIAAKVVYVIIQLLFVLFASICLGYFLPIGITVVVGVIDFYDFLCIWLVTGFIGMCIMALLNYFYAVMVYKIVCAIECVIKK